MYEVVIDGPTKHPDWRLIAITPTPSIKELIKDFLRKYEGSTNIPYEVLEEYAKKLKELEDVKAQIVRGLQELWELPQQQQQRIQIAMKAPCHVFKIASCPPLRNNHFALREYINENPKYTIAYNWVNEEIEMYRKTKDGWVVV